MKDYFKTSTERKRTSDFMQETNNTLYFTEREGNTAKIREVNIYIYKNAGLQLF